MLLNRMNDECLAKCMEQLNSLGTAGELKRAQKIMMEQFAQFKSYFMEECEKIAKKAKSEHLNGKAQ